MFTKRIYGVAFQSFFFSLVGNDGLAITDERHKTGGKKIFDYPISII